MEDDTVETWKEVLHVTLASEYDTVEDKLAKEVLLVTLAAEDDAFEDKVVKQVLHVTLAAEDDTVEENIVWIKGGHSPFKEKKKIL